MAGRFGARSGVIKLTVNQLASQDSDWISLQGNVDGYKQENEGTKFLKDRENRRQQNLGVGAGGLWSLGELLDITSGLIVYRRTMMTPFPLETTRYVEIPEINKETIRSDDSGSSATLSALAPLDFVGALMQILSDDISIPVSVFVALAFLVISALVVMIRHREDIKNEIYGWIASSLFSSWIKARDPEEVRRTLYEMDKKSAKKRLGILAIIEELAKIEGKGMV